MIVFELLFRTWQVSLNFFVGHFHMLHNFALLPGVSLTFLSLGERYFSSPYLSFASMISHIVLYIMFAVAWHNYVITGDASRTVWQYLKWDRSKWRYLGVFLLMVFAIVLAMNIAVRPGLWLLHTLNDFSLGLYGKAFVENIPPLDLGWVDLFAFIGFLGLCYPLSRVMYILPLAALGRENIFRRSLEISSSALGFTFLLFLSLGFFQVFFGLGNIIVRYSILNLFGDEYWSLLLLGEFIWQMVNYLTLAFLITPLSLGFKVLDN